MSLFDFSISELISGMGSWAGEPYSCTIVGGLTSCIKNPGHLSVQQMVDNTNNWADSNDIDDTINMQNDR